MLYTLNPLVYCASFLTIVFLLESRLLLLKGFGFKICVWQYSTVLAIKKCMILCLVFALFYLKLVNDFSNLLSALVSIPVCIFLKHRMEYSDALVNDSQRDTESIGAFWAHQAYDAYYKKVLCTIKERLITFEKEHDDLVQFPVKKLILIIPLSCDIENLLTDRDEKIKFIENLPELECDQGANINRIIKNPVYKVILDQEVYVAAECPSPLSTLWKTQNILGKEKMIYHRDCFIKTLKILVKGSPCIVVDYDDEIYRLSECLRNVLEMERLTQTVHGRHAFIKMQHTNCEKNVDFH